MIELNVFEIIFNHKPALFSLSFFSAQRVEFDCYMAAHLGTQNYLLAYYWDDSDQSCSPQCLYNFSSYLSDAFDEFLLMDVSFEWRYLV